MSIDTAMSELSKRIPTVVAVGAAALMLSFVAGCSDAVGDDKGGGGPPPAPPVSVAEVFAKEVAEWDEFSGRLEAVETVEIRPRVTGYLQSVNFKAGTEVKKGQVLFAIDARPYQAEVARAEAELTRAQSVAALAKSEVARAERLLAAKAISQQEYDQRVAGNRDGDAGIRAAQAALRAARLNVEFSTIRAPISGRISKAEVTVGNLVNPGTTLLTTIVSQDPIYAYFEADEQLYLKYVGLSKSGVRPSSRDVKNPIYLGLANEDGHPHKGVMDFVDNRLDAKSGTMRGRAVFDNKEGRFTPGLFARLKLVGSGTYKAVLINDRAVGTDQTQKFVLVVDKDNKTSYRPIKVGALIDGMRVVRDGLKPGELIVVNGLQRVRPGMPVTPQKVPMDKPNGNGESPKTANAADKVASADNPSPAKQ